jgi:type I restriction enzyme R subunit
LRAALEKLNPKFPPEAIASALDELTRDRSAMTLAGANREVCGLLKDGVKVVVPDRERGGLRDERVRVVDWENPAANDFLLVSQMTVTGQLYTCRPDLIGFVNGRLSSNANKGLFDKNVPGRRLGNRSSSASRAQGRRGRPGV